MEKLSTNCYVQHSFENSVVSSAEIISASKLSTQNGAVLNVGQVQDDITRLSHFSSTETSGSSNRIEGESDINGLSPKTMTMAETNSDYNSLLQQELGLKIRENEEEIMNLRRRLSEYSYREAQIHDEKSILEKRVTFMRMAFDRQQHNLAEATSKALSYKQDIVEDNIRLAYALQEAQEDRLTFVSSLLPLLADYSLQPQALDAQSIVTNIRVLFKHLHEKLRVTEAKVRDSYYQPVSLRPNLKETHAASTSPTPSKTLGLELVPFPGSAFETIPVNYVSTHVTDDLDALARNQNIRGGRLIVQNQENVESVTHSPLSSRNAGVLDPSSELSEMTEISHNPVSVDNKSYGDSDNPDIERRNSNNETSSSSYFHSTAYTAPITDPSCSYSPLSPVFEEPFSSFSEADDDPLPAIEGLQISGEAFPGRELQACGFSINGTTSCNFEWVRHLENGSVNYIEGAKQPLYTVTADDVDSYLSIEVEPLDDRKRRGELVKVFANEHRKIRCDVEMGQHIEKSFSTGHVVYKVSLSTGYMDIWEAASLSIKRDGYSIKCNGNGGIGISEKFLPSTRVNIVVGNLQELAILGSGGVEHLLSVDSNYESNCSRDTIVLTMRLFIFRAIEKKRGRKKGLFFNK